MLTPDRYEEIRRRSVGALSNANSTFQKAIIRGIKENIQYIKDKIYIINTPNIGAYPFKYKNVYFKKGDFELFTIEGLNISFCDLPKFKHYYIYHAVYTKLKGIIGNMRGNTVVLVYDLYWPFIKAVSRIKNEYDIKTCLVVPDLPGFTGEVDHWAYRLFRSRKRVGGNWSLLNQIDSYVLLAETMRDKLPINGSNYIVVEGIFDSENVKKNTQVNNTNLKIIFYSGALDERNGVLRLLEAFRLIEDSSFRLIVCGDGELRGEVSSMAKIDNRIIYKGQISHEEVLELQAESTLLVNPRTPFDEFTKYSFPSKTMEYLASGRPVLMYQLPTLPREYFPYCYFVSGNSVSSLADKMREICLKSSHELNQRGEDARSFILNNKTSKVQVKKIIDLLNSLV